MAWVWRRPDSFTQRSSFVCKNRHNGSEHIGCAMTQGNFASDPASDSGTAAKNIRWLSVLDAGHCRALPEDVVGCRTVPNCAAESAADCRQWQLKAQWAT